MSHHETAIIGSGPYGLSLAAHLRHYGVPHSLFGQPMQSWSNFMPKGMLLKSEAGSVGQPNPKANDEPHHSHRRHQARAHS